MLFRSPEGWPGNAGDAGAHGHLGRHGPGLHLRPGDGRAVLRRQPGGLIGHVSPEAAAGGLMAYVQDGDQIAIDIPNHSINLLVSEEEISKRKAASVPQPPKQVTGYLKRYRAMVTSANKGAILNDETL